MGGLKRKIPTDEKIKKKESKSVAFSKRRKGLYSKASQLCVLSRAQVAILATPPCSKSNVSFYSFGHSSVDSVVSAFLKNQYPRGDHLGESEHWWEDERLAESEDPKELSEAVDSISRMVQNLKGTLRSKALANREDAKKKKKEVAVDQSQTLYLQSAGASSSCIHEDQPENLLGLVENVKEEDQKVAVADKNKNNNNIKKELDGNLTLGFETSFPSLCIQDVPPVNVEGLVNNNNNNIKKELDGNQTLGFETSFPSLCIQDVSLVSEQTDQHVVSSDISSNNNGLLGNVDGFDQVLYLDEDDFIDFEMNSEGFITTSLETDNVSTSQSTAGSEGSAEDGALVVVHSNSKKDDQIVAVYDNNNALPGDLYWCNQEMRDDVSMMVSTNQNQCSNPEADEHGAVAVHRDLEQDNLHFSDFFNALFPNGEF